MSADEKRYFWIKIRQDFFNDPYIKLLRRMAGGDTYTIIYLEMLVKSADTNGTIYFQGAGSDIAEELALMLNENVEDVRALLAYLEAKKLISHPDLSEDIYLVATPDLTGSETGSARRVREFRKRQENQKALQSNTEVTNSNDSKSKSKSKSKNIDIELENTTTEKKAVSKSQRENISAYQKVLRYYEDSGYGLASPIITQKMNYELQDFVNAGSTFEQAADIICKAMEIGAMNNAKTFSYVLKITKGWLEHNLKTLEQVEAYINRPTFSNSNYGRAEKVEPKLDKQQQPEEFKMTKEEREKWIRDNI